MAGSFYIVVTIKIARMTYVSSYIIINDHISSINNRRLVVAGY